MRLELVQAVLDGRRDATARFADALTAAADGRERAALLDPLAHAAATSSRALEALLGIVHHEHLATSAIHRLVVDRHDAEEVEQDVLIAVARSIASYRGDARFTTWLHAVARHAAIDFLRRRRAALTLDEAAPLTAGQRMSSLIATRETLRSAIAALAPEYRQPVVLRDIEHLPYQDIADRLGLKLNTAKSRIFRGRALLAGALGPTGTGDPLGDEPGATSGGTGG